MPIESAQIDKSDMTPHRKASNDMELSSIKEARNKVDEFENKVSSSKRWELGALALAGVAAIFVFIFSQVGHSRNDDLRIADKTLETLEIEKLKADAREDSLVLENSLEKERTERLKLEGKAEGFRLDIAKANRAAAEANLKAENMRKQNLELESVLAPRTIEQMNSSGPLQIIPNISVMIESLAESEPWRLAGQIAFMLDRAASNTGAQWEVLPGMKRYIDGSLFFDGVVVEANVGAIPKGDRSDEAANALVAVLMENHLEARRGPTAGLPPNTIRVRVGLKPSQYFNRNRTDNVYGNKLYK